MQVKMSLRIYIFWHAAFWILALAAFSGVAAKSCTDFARHGPLELTIQENAQENTLLLDQSGSRLYPLRTYTSFLKVQHDKLYTSRKINIDGDQNKALCSEFESVIVLTLDCLFYTFRRITVDLSINYTDDHPTQLLLPTVSVKEEAKDLLIVDWSSSAEKAKVVKDDDCGTEIDLQIEENDDTQEFFEIRSGPSIWTKKAFDFEKKPQHILNITAFSTLPGKDPTATHGQLVINVEDVDDTDPFFEQKVFNMEITESDKETERKATGPKINATDGDIGINATLEYTIESCEPDLVARVSNDGELFVSGPLDRETTKTYRIIVRASQIDNSSATATATVSLTVRDMNDNRPKFSPQQVLSVGIAVGASTGSHVTWLFADDADEGDNAEFDFIIHADLDAFMVTKNPDSKPAELVVKNSALLDALQSIDVEVRLKEKRPVAWGETCDFMKTCAINITVTVEDQNHHTPIFSRSHYVVSLDPGMEAGTVFGQIRATDGDTGISGDIMYRLSPIPGEGDPDCGKVKVHSLTGELTLVQRMTAAGRTCTYRAFACDTPLDKNKRKCGSSMVALVVLEPSQTDVTSDVLLSDVYMLENLAIGTIVMTLPELGLATDNKNFYIDGKLLKTAVVLDKERRAAHIISIGKKHGKKIDETLRITVYVQNVNDHAPLFDRDDYEVTLTDNAPAGTAILTISATDQDGLHDMVTYSLRNMKDVFGINTFSGEIFLLNPSWELWTSGWAEGGSSVLLVEAKDSGLPALTSFASVTIHFPQPPVYLLLPVGKDDLMKNKSNIASEMSKVLGIRVQILAFEANAAGQDKTLKTCLNITTKDD